MNVTMNFSDETMRRKETPMTTIETISWSKRAFFAQKQHFQANYFTFALIMEKRGWQRGARGGEKVSLFC